MTSGAVTVEKITPTVSLNEKTEVYTGSAISIGTATVTLANSETYSGNVTYTYYTDSGCSTLTTAANSGASEDGAAPVNAGTYYVKASIAEQTNYTAAESTAVSLIISKAASSVTTAPTAATGLVYNGSEQALVSGGAVTGGTLEYCSTSDGEYSETVPTGTAAGDYTFYYKVVGDSNHEDTTAVKVDVTIAKAASSVTTAPTSASPTYNGMEQALVSAGEASGGEMQYSTSENGTYSAAIPTGTDAGSYTVYYKVVGDSNHNDYTAGTPISVTISQATPTDPTTPTPSAVTYSPSQTLSSIALTDGWTWANGDTVPQVGNSGYTAYYTVSDYTNYDWSQIDGYNSTEHRVERTVSLTVNASQLAAPTNLQWSGTTTTVTASWDEVTNASSYAVQLYKGDTAEGSAVPVTGTSTDFTITEAGSYTFTVTAVGTGNYSSSAESAASAALVYYTVTWKNDDTTLKTDVVQSGETPSYSGDTPTKDTDSTYIYAFSGWSPDVVAISGNTTYDAQYSLTYVAPAASEGYTIDYSAETATAAEGYEISTDGSTWSSSTLAVTPSGTLYVRRAADTAASASAATANTLAARPSAPSVTAVNEQWLNENDGQITGVTTEMEYRLSGGTWADCSGTTVTGLAAGNYEVRYKATTSAFASTAATVTIASGTARTYTLTVTAPTFAAVTYGYTQPEAANITITSTGNSAAAITGVTVGSTNFTISGSGSTVTAGGTIDTWTIQPAANLAAGTYNDTITVTYNGTTVTADVSFTVNKATPSVTAPSAAADLVYSGNAQNLISEGSTTGGTMYYSLTGENDWTTSVPTGTSANTYTVYYKVVGDSNYTDLTPASNSVNVTIAKATLTPSISGTATKTYDGTATASGLTIALTGAVNNESPTATATSYTYNSANVSEATTITATGIALGDDWGTNYKLDATTATTGGTITAASLTDALFSVDTGSETYVGSEITKTINSSLALDTDYTVAYTDNTNVGTAAITITGKGNYTGTLTYNFAITAATQTGVSATGYSGSYDGAAHGITVTAEGATVTYSETENGTYAADNPTYTDAGTYTVYYKVTRANYADYTGSETVVINKVTLTPSISGTTEKTYDGSNAASGLTIELSGAVGTENPTATASSYTYNSANVSEAATITAAGIALGAEWQTNYELGAATATTGGTITAKSVTASISGTATKTYDGTTSASGLSISLDDVITADSSNVTASAASYAYDSASAGSKTVTASGITLGGSAAGNYTLESYTATATGTIDKKTVTATVTAADKVYDSTNTATVSATVSDGIIDGDSISISGLTGTFAQSGVGTGISVNVVTEGASVSGTNYENYTITYNTTGVTASITKATPATVIFPTASDITYGATLSDSTLSNGSGDGTFAWTEPNTVPTVTNSGYSVTFTPSDATNYDYSNVTLTQTVYITVEKALSNVDTAPIANALTYTGGAQELVTAGAATGGTIYYSLEQNGDYATTIPTGTTAGTYTVYYKVVGDDNHEDTAAASVNAEIGKVTLTPTISGTTTKIYDGTTDASNLSIELSGAVGSESPTATAASYTYNSANVSEATTITATGIALSTEWQTNYKLSADTVTTGGTITAATQTGVSASGYSGSYNGAAHGITVTAEGATVTYSETENGTYAADNPTYTNAGEYTVYYKVTRANYADYTGSATVEISKVTLTPSISGTTSKTYDGSTDASGLTIELSGAVDTETPSATASFAYDSTDAGDRTITASNITLGGTWETNYVLNKTEISTSGTIVAKSVTASISGTATKTYDGTTSVSGLSISLDGVITADSSNVTASAASYAYDSADAGSKTVTASDITLSGSAAGNYSLASNSATASGTITAASLTGDMFTVDTVSVTYNGSEITKTINSSLTLDTDYTVAYADNTNVGTATITITGKGNYIGTLTYSFAITAATQTDVTASGYSGSYDGAAHGITVTAVGSVTYSTTGSDYTADNPTYTNAGTYTVYYKVTRANYDDYTGSETVVINKVTLTPSISGTTEKTYDGSADANGLTITLTGAVNGEGPSATASFAYDSADAGGRTITASNIALDSTWETNYTLSDTTASTSGTIVAKSVTASISGTTEKTYDGTTSASGLSISLDGVITADSSNVTASAASYVYDSASAGSRTVTASGITLNSSAAGNYTLANDSATTTGTINKKEVTATVTAADKVYDTTNTATVSAMVSNGVVSGDSISVSGLTGTFADVNVGTDKTVTVATESATVSGTNYENYTITYNITGVTASITKATPATVIFPTASDITYGATLASSELTGGSGDGTFAWTEPEIVPTVTNSGYSVTFTPSDATNYDYSGVTLTQTVAITVEKALSSVDTAPTANALTYTGSAQTLVEAGTATGGTMYYSSEQNGDYATTIPTGTTAGTYTVYYKVIGDDNHSDYTPTSNSVSVTISKATLTPSISGTATKTYDGDTSVTSSLSIELTGVLAADSSNVTASAASYTYDSASAGSRSVTASGITLSGSAAGNYTLASDTATATGTITEASLTGDMFSVDTGSVTYIGSAITKTIDSSLALDTDYTVAYADNTNVGTATIIISGIGNYSGDMTYSFTINKADPTYTLPTGLTAVYGDTLANVALTDGWTWDSSAASVGSVGTKSFSATFTPSDTDNYNNVTEILSVTVAPLPVTVTWSGTSFTYDGTEKTVTAVVANAVGGDTVSLTYEGNTGTAVGSYTAKVTAVSDDNYTIVGAAGLEQEWSITAGAGITVTFDANGRSATNMPAQQTGLYYGDKLTEPEDPIADDSDYGFVGWYTDTDCTAAWDFESDTVGTEDITLYAKWEQVYFAVGVTVLDSSGNAYDGDATITLMRGSEVIDTKSITNGTGQFSEHVEAGMYNVVVSYTDDNDTHTKTALITVDDDATVTVTLPPAGVNSTLTVSDSSETPAVMVGGLDEEAAAVMAELQASGSLAEDVYKVTVTMIVEGSQEADVDSAAADAIKNIAEEVAVGTEGSSTVVDYLDVSVTRQINDNSGEAVSETNTVLEVVVPFVFDGRDNIVVVRHHEGNTEQLQKLAAMPSSYADGTFYLNESTGYIHIYAQKFSVYAVAYTTTETYDITFDDCNGTTVVATTSTDGKLAELPAPADRGSYTFNGWYTAAEGGTQVTTSYVFTKDTTVYAHWTAQATTTGGSGGGSHSYGTSVESADNGAVTVSPANAASGTTVTLTVTPDEGYELASLTVTGGGEEITVTKASDTEYTFTMPSSRVTVEATFTEISGTHDDCSSEHFTDVDTEAWYHEYIDYVVDNGLMTGTSATTFEPDTATTRGMIATILHRLESEPTASTVHSFGDVASASYYEQSIAWAEENGIVQGYGDGTFRPDDAITREQLAAILYRYAQYKGYDVSIGEDTNILSYNDAAEISEYAVPALQWAVGAGLIEGTDTVTLSPQQSATRAQVAAILTRFIEGMTA